MIVLMPITQGIDFIRTVLWSVKIVMNLLVRSSSDAGLYPSMASASIALQASCRGNNLHVPAGLWYQGCNISLTPGKDHLLHTAVMGKRIKVFSKRSLYQCGSSLIPMMLL